MFVKLINLITICNLLEKESLQTLKNASCIAIQPTVLSLTRNFMYKRVVCYF
jgi:hypothetical protein